MSDYMRAVAYARYSSEMQREESIEAQIRAISEYADKRKLRIVHEYVDRAKSATSDKRPEFLQMVRDSQDHTFDVVIVHKLDRFSRDRYDSAFYKRELKRNGVSVHSVTEQLDDSPESVILESVIEGMSEYYSKNLGREVMKGLSENARKCMSTGGPPPFGYRVDHETKKLVLDEHEAEGVKLIFDRILEGYSYREVIEELNRHGYITRSGRPFAINSLHNLLKNEKYRGCYTFNKSSAKDADGKRNGHGYKPEDKMIKTEGGCPRIVSDEDFFIVQQKMRIRQQPTNHPNCKENYLLRGKMFCGKCGGAYVGSRRKRGDGSTWAYYGCNQKMRRKQKHNHTKDIGKSYIEEIALKKLAEYAFSDANVKPMVREYNAYLDSQEGGQKEINLLKKQLAKLDADLDGVAECLIRTKSATLYEKLDKLEQQKAGIQKEIFERERVYTVSHVTEEELRCVFQIIRSKIESSNLNTIKQLIEVYVNRIEVTPDAIVLQFNFFPKVSVPFPDGGGTVAFAMPQAQLHDGAVCGIAKERSATSPLLRRLTLVIKA